MSEQEAQDMMRDKENRQLLQAEQNRLRELASMVLRCIGMNDPDEGIVVLDQDEAGELLEMATIYAE